MAEVYTLVHASEEIPLKRFQWYDSQYLWISFLKVEIESSENYSEIIWR